MGPINIKQLAGQLGVSSSTISRAMRDSYEISPATRQRVQFMAQQLNYQPNPYAGSLRNNVSKTIGVILPEVNNHFFSLAINGIEEVAQQNGYHVLIYLTHDSESQEKTVSKYLTSGRVDGVLLAMASGTRSIGHLEKLKKLGIPLVLFDRVSEKLNTATVTTDDYSSAYRATEHLLEAGCRQVAYLLVSSNLSIGNKRQQGYVDALQAHGIAYDADLILNGTGSNEENQHLITQLLLRRPEIDGLFASVESLAMSSYRACEAVGRKIPDDIKIVSFSNLEVASLLAPALTTITQPAYDIGRQAAQLIVQSIAKKKPALASQSLELKSELVIRKSTENRVLI